MTKRNEKTSPAVARDASAILKFKVEPFIDADTGLECVTVPMTYISRARRVAASALTQAADKPKPRKERPVARIARGLREAIKHAEGRALRKPKRAVAKRSPAK